MAWPPRSTTLCRKPRVALDAGAAPHADCALKAVALVLARAAVAMAPFEEGSDEWREHISTIRPECDPRYEVSGDLPVGP